MDIDIEKWYKDKFINNVKIETRCYVEAFSIIWTQYEYLLYGCHFEKYKSSKYNNEIQRLIKVFNENKDIYEKFMLIIGNLKDYCVLNHKPPEETYNRFLFENDPRNRPVLNKQEFLCAFNSSKVEDEIILVISLLGRVRNNLFHGEKDISSLNNQVELFKNLEKFMILSIDTFWY